MSTLYDIVYTIHKSKCLVPSLKFCRLELHSFIQNWMFVCLFSMCSDVWCDRPLWNFYHVFILTEKKREILVAFSAFTNGRTIFSFEHTKSPDVIECLNGIRAITTAWVIFTHSYHMYTVFPTNNKTSVFAVRLFFIWIILYDVDSLVMLHNIFFQFTAVISISIRFIIIICLVGIQVRFDVCNCCPIGRRDILHSQWIPSDFNTFKTPGEIVSDFYCFCYFFLINFNFSRKQEWTSEYFWNLLASLYSVNTAPRDRRTLSVIGDKILWGWSPLGANGRRVKSCLRKRLVEIASLRS